MKQMHLRVDDALYEELNTYSVETEQSMQACVREAVAYYITDKKKKQIPVLKSQFTFIDLFAGIGGMRLAYENVGGRCVYSNEWNKYSQQTYYANFGEQPEGHYYISCNEEERAGAVGIHADACTEVSVDTCQIQFII